MDLGDGIKIIPSLRSPWLCIGRLSTFRRSQTLSSSAEAAEQASPSLYRIHRCQQRRGQHQTYLDRGVYRKTTIGMIPDVVSSVTDVNKFVDGKRQEVGRTSKDYIDFFPAHRIFIISNG